MLVFQVPGVKMGLARLSRQEGQALNRQLVECNRRWWVILLIKLSSFAVAQRTAPRPRTLCDSLGDGGCLQRCQPLVWIDFSTATVMRNQLIVSIRYGRA